MNRVNIYFAPFHLVSFWTEPNTTTKCISASMLLPTDVESSDLSPRVRDGGRELKLSVSWPEEFSNVETFQRKWLQYTTEKI